MCGISGIFHNSKAADSAEVKLFSENLKVLKSRGPDSSHVWSSDGILLGHTRLSILDLSEQAAQPMISRSGKLVLVFNGEFYNFRDFSSSGPRFQSDSRWFLEEVCKNGLVATLAKARGMFAGAIYDLERSELSLFRDPFGKKPLYWCEHNGSFFFGSTVRNVILNSKHDSLSSEFLSEYLSFGYGLCDSPIEGVNRLEGGNILVVKGGTARQMCFVDSMRQTSFTAVKRTRGN